MKFLSSSKSEEFVRSLSTGSSPDRATSTSPSRSALGRLYRKLSPKRTPVQKPATADCGTEDAVSGPLREVFEYFDENGDGRISPDELRSCVNALGGDLSPEEAAMAVEASDLNGDGLLEFKEFERLVEGCGEEERYKDLKEAFGMYEMEGSGCITAASLKQMLTRIGDSRSLEDCKAMIRAFDLNGDGVLSFDEFRVMMR